MRDSNIGELMYSTLIRDVDCRFDSVGHTDSNKGEKITDAVIVSCDRVSERRISHVLSSPVAPTAVVMSCRL